MTSPVFPVKTCSYMVPGTVEFQDFYGDTSVFYYVFIIIGLTEETSSNIYYCIHYSTANTVTSQYDRSMQTYSICTEMFFFFTVLLKYSIFKQILLLFSICFFFKYGAGERRGESERKWGRINSLSPSDLSQSTEVLTKYSCLLSLSPHVITWSCV